MSFFYIIPAIFCFISQLENTQASHPPASLSLEERAHKIISESLVIDAELSLLENKNGVIPTGLGVIKKQTGINVGFWPYDAKSIKRVNQWIRDNSKSIVLITHKTDFNELIASKKFGVLLMIEQPSQNTRDLEELSLLKTNGLRVYQPAYGNLSSYGAGFNDDQAPLTSDGVRLIHELNRLKIIIDVSHVGKTTTLDIANRTRLPLLAGHSNAEALAGHPRNKSNEELKAIAKTGGVIGVTPISEYLKKSPTDQPGLSDLIHQIDYLVQLIGIDHIGLGSDSFLDGTTTAPYTLAGPELSSQKRWFNLVVALLNKGYSEQDIRKILGLNYQRVIMAHLN